MSTILGLVSRKNKPIDSIAFDAIYKAMHHWQADDAQKWFNETKNVAFGHFMLWNTPESKKEKLPFSNPENRFTITADARIDNREELFELLSLHQDQNNPLPDSYLILKLFERFKEQCVAHLIGDFAFAIWDHIQEELFCARDQMGIKPFFYYHDRDKLIFASEKKGIMSYPGFVSKYDLRILFRNAFYFEYDCTRTTTKKIFRLAPAHCLSLKKGKLKLWRYWDLKVTKSLTITEDEAAEQLKELLKNAVKCRLRSDYPIGAELSGGVDSSAITGLAAPILVAQNKSLFTFSNVFSKESKQKYPELKDEYEYIKSANDFNQIKHAFYIDQPYHQDPSEQLKKITEIHDGLEQWSGDWLLSSKKEIQKHKIRTVLSGFGGDEMVSHKGQFHFLHFLEQKKLIKYLKADQHPSDKGFNRLIPLIPILLFIPLSLLKGIIIPTKKRNNNEIFKLPWWIERIPLIIVYKELAYFRPFRSYKYFLRYNVLKSQKSIRSEAETKMGIYFNHEVRYPLLDIRLLQFFISLPDEYKYKYPYKGRPLFLNATKAFLPNKIITRAEKSIETGFNGGVAPFELTPERKGRPKKAIEEMLRYIIKS
ncbi:asparagine synthase-related protein [Sediminibacterium sp.]|uniref:asparagine synthase-related protein n=1 Tax=Sediminibacterium sp. TaxID=1917865 RepID=UPI003F6FDD4A